MESERLARELKISGKHLRHWLRTEYPRPLALKHTAWDLTPAQVAAARRRFATRHVRAESREGMQVTTVAFPERMYRRLSAIAEETRTSVNELTRQAVEEWLARRRKA